MVRSDVHIDVLVSLILVFDAVLSGPNANRSLPLLVQKRLLSAKRLLPPLRALALSTTNLAHTIEARRKGMRCCIAVLGRNKETMLRF